MMRAVRKYLLLVAALLLLLTEALWTRLRIGVEWVVDRLPLERLKQAARRFLEWLPAYPTLFLFLVPLVATEPLKFVSYWLIAKRHWILGPVLYVSIDVLRLALVSFFFGVSRDKLLSIGWFRVLYDWTVRAHDWAHELVAPYRAWAKRIMADALERFGSGRGGLAPLVRRLKRRLGSA